MKVIKFGAEWCPGCLIMKPIWSEIEAEAPWLQTEYYDYDQSEAEVEKYKIDDKLPCFIFLDNQDKEILRLTGEVPKEKLWETIIENKD